MELDRFLVCGLGSLGQHCVANLKTFGVTVSAIDLTQPGDWEIPNLPTLLENFLIGDCCIAGVLEQAGVRQCRAILLVTQNERVNLEAALTARVINPSIRVVIRSDKQNLNQLLGHQLGNFVAFEPTQLSATAFALAAFGEELLGFFRLGEYQFQVIKQRITQDHRWCDKRCIHDLNTSTRRVLRHIPADQTDLPPNGLGENDSAYPFSPSTQFYAWSDNAKIRAGDIVVTITAEPELKNIPTLKTKRSRWRFGRFGRDVRRIKSWRAVKQSVVQFWRSSYEHQIRRVAVLCGVTVTILCIVGVVLLRLYYPHPNHDLTLLDAFYATVVLLLGGYGDLFNDLPPHENLPWWLRLFSLGLTLAGTAFIGVLYALLTEKLLTLKFQFLSRRPPVPLKAHVVVISLGRVGQRVATLLQELKQPIVGVNQKELEADILPQMPLITGNIAKTLTKANLTNAKSVVAVSDDEVQNLEMGLMAHRVNSDCRLIIRTYDQHFSDKVAQLFPYTQVLCASALSAEAFAAAAFGENVVSLFRLFHQTILVTQYTIEAQDTLNGLLISEIAYGYGVEPILHLRFSNDSPKVMPSDDIQLQAGDRLFVLASIRGLRRIERGQLSERQWRIKVEEAIAHDARFDGAGEIARITGCDIGVAREFMAHLPNVFPQQLYLHQALRLVRRLTRLRVKAEVMSKTLNSIEMKTQRDLVE